MVEQAPLLAYDPLLEQPRGIEPYSVLYTTSQPWVHRKAAWTALGIRPEVKGRSKGLLLSNQAELLAYDVVCPVCGHKPAKSEYRDPRVLDGQPQLDDMPGRQIRQYPKAGEPCDNPRVPSCFGIYQTAERASQQTGALAYGTSIFDPVLAELLYRWFSPPGGTVLDPFAGGAVRGVVAWKVGRQYVGVELRPEQVADNQAQREANGWGVQTPYPYWVQGDSADVLQWAPPPYAPGHVVGMGPYDFILTCPPYYDAEVYSDDPRDLSNLDDYLGFQAAYYDIMAKACKLLRENRYAAVVVGEARSGTTGEEYGLVQDTCAALREAGLVQHAHMVLVNALGTLPLRAGRAWEASRAPGRHHQHVLVYRKGERKAAAEAMEPLVLFDVTPTNTKEDTDGAS